MHLYQIFSWVNWWNYISKHVFHHYLVQYWVWQSNLNAHVVLANNKLQLNISERLVANIVRIKRNSVQFNSVINGNGMFAAFFPLLSLYNIYISLK